ncbi:MAG: DUF3108 domain-containing protein [Flavobacteriaceae bacterium]
MSICCAQEKDLLPETSSQNAFKDGEWFEFRIHYGVFNASKVTLGITADTLDQVPVFHAKGYGRTTGLARWFFKVEDHYQSYFGQKDGLPRWFLRDIDEGGYTKDLEIRFDHTNKMAHINDKKKKKKSSHAIEDNVQDLLSAFYYIRNFYDTSRLKKGDAIRLNMFFDQENYLFKLHCLGRETIETSFGKVRCLKLRPYVQSGRVFSEQESVTLWVSDDQNKVPIKMRADLRVGAIDCDLENFKNLQYPFSIEVK